MLSMIMPFPHFLEAWSLGVVLQQDSYGYIRSDLGMSKYQRRNCGTKKNDLRELVQLSICTTTR